MSWRRWAAPVLAGAVTSQCSTSYGVGSPSTYNLDGKSHIRLFYEDFCGYTLYSVTSFDGVHFSKPTEVTKNGLSYCDSTHAGGIPTDANFAFDPAHDDWYATMDLGCFNGQRGGERGTIGFKLFRTHGAATASLTGSWEEVATFDTNLTGYEINSWPAPARDSHGNLGGNVEVFFSVSSPRASATASSSEDVAATDPTHWDIAWATWVASARPVTPLRRYRGGTHDVTTGYADRALFPVDEGSLGLLYTAPQGATTVALYNCQLGTSADFFVSTDLMCEGQRIIGLEGYALTASAANTYPLYRCVVGGAQHFVSHDPKCEGQKTESLLGYALSQ